jgi:hypothetical protein
MNIVEKLRMRRSWDNIILRIEGANDVGFNRLVLEYPLESVLAAALRSEGFEVDVIGNLKTIITW